MRPTYSPIIPIAMSWMPPSSSTATTVVVTPGTNAPKMRKTIATGIARKASIAQTKPATVAICSGTLENEAIASSAKRAILRIGYFVVPAWRAARL